MKKLVCMLLTLALMMSCSVVAFAVSDSENVYSLNEDPTTIEVKGEIEEGTADIVAQIDYMIVIEWSVSSGSAAKLDTSGTYHWNEYDLKYEPYTDTHKTLYGETPADVCIEITNKSNADVAYNIAWARSDSAPSALSITESAKESYVKTGTLIRADRAFAEAGAVSDGFYGGYDIDESKLGNITGTATTGEYEGYVTFGSNDADDLTTGEFTLGTYTITLSPTGEHK